MRSLKFLHYELLLRVNNARCSARSNSSGMNSNPDFATAPKTPQVLKKKIR